MPNVSAVSTMVHILGNYTLNNSGFMFCMSEYQ